MGKASRAGAARAGADRPDSAINRGAPPSGHRFPDRPALRTLTPPSPSLTPPPFPSHRERGGFKRLFFVVLPPLPVRGEGRGRERRAGEVRAFRLRLRY